MLCQMRPILPKMQIPKSIRNTDNLDSDKDSCYSQQQTSWSREAREPVRNTDHEEQGSREGDGHCLPLAALCSGCPASKMHLFVVRSKDDRAPKTRIHQTHRCVTAVI